MQVTFYGGSHYVLPILKILEPALVVTTEKNSFDPVTQYCTDNKIPFLSVTSLSKEPIKQKLQEKATEVAVLADFGLIIPNNILNLYPKGIVNVHPSLLPKYRGPTPGQSTILNNEKQMGVTLIKLDSEVDHGAIIAQSSKPLPPEYTGEDLYRDMFAEGANLLKANLDGYISGTIKPTQQKHTDATFTPKLTRQSGYFNILNPPEPETLQLMIRAYYPWPGVWSKLQMANGKWQIVKFLPQGKLQMEGKKPVSLKDFYNGYPELRETISRLMANG